MRIKLKSDCSLTVEFEDLEEGVTFLMRTKVENKESQMKIAKMVATIELRLSRERIKLKST